MLNFQQLYGELESALQLSKDAKVARMKDEIFSRAERNVPNYNVGDQEVLFAGEGKYGRPPKGTQKKALRIGKLKRKVEPLEISGCFHCGDPNHMVKDCKVPLNVARAAANKLEYFAKREATAPYSTHLLLAELCRQMDIDVPSDKEGLNDDEGSDRQIFESLLETSEDANLQFVHDCMGTDCNDDDESVSIVFAKNEDFISIRCVCSNDQANPPFQGACVDTGAQKSIIGKPQALAYCKLANVKILPNYSRRRFKFGEQSFPYTGVIQVRIPLSTLEFLEYKIPVVDVDIPLLLGLELLVKFNANIDVGNMRLSAGNGHWPIPMVHKMGYIYVTWSKSALLYTTEELRKVHRHFSIRSHSASSLYFDERSRLV